MADATPPADAGTVRAGRPISHADALELLRRQASDAQMRRTEVRNDEAERAAAWDEAGELRRVLASREVELKAALSSVAAVRALADEIATEAEEAWDANRITEAQVLLAAYERLIATLDGSAEAPAPEPDPQPVNTNLLDRMREGVTSREPAEAPASEPVDDALPQRPNDPPCPHDASAHDHPGYISARATCCVDGCVCGDQAVSVGPTEAAEPREDREARIRHLEALPAGWDSYGSAPVQSGVGDRARQILAWFTDDPAISATSEGGIDLAWSDESVSIEVRPAGYTVVLGENELVSDDARKLNCPACAQWSVLGPTAEVRLFEHWATVHAPSAAEAGAPEPARHREGPGGGFPRVAGRCPACGWASLFLAVGEHITCSRLDCPDPCAADELLARGEAGNPAGSVTTTPDPAAPLTFELYEHIVNLAYAAHREWYPIQKWRRGQAYANVLHTLAPRIQERVEKAGRDVFYRDDLIPAYLDEVRAALAGSTPKENEHG